MSFLGLSDAHLTTLGTSFLGLSLLQWTALAAIAGFLLAIAAVVTIIVTVCTARTARDRDDAHRKEDRDRDDRRRQEDRKWDSDRRKEDREHDAELRRQDREREDQLRRDSDDKWERRRREEQRQREDDDAQQNVIVEFQPGGPGSTRGRAVTTGDGITHRIIVRAPAAYPVKQVAAQIAHRDSAGISIVDTGGWTFERPVFEDGQAQFLCWARVSADLRDAAPIVRFADRSSNLYYSYQGLTRRFGENTDFHAAASEIDKWRRTGPRPDYPDN